MKVADLAVLVIEELEQGFNLIHKIKKLYTSDRFT